MMPRGINGFGAQSAHLRCFGDKIELEHSSTRYSAAPARMRLIALPQSANMGGYRDAIALVPAAAAPFPNLAATRRKRAKHGFGINLGNRHDGRGRLGARAFGVASWNIRRGGRGVQFTEIELVGFGGIRSRGPWGPRWPMRSASRLP